MAKQFNPGKLRNKITFYNPPNDLDNYGELLDDWIIFKTVRASKEPLIGREFFAALTAETKVTVKFRMRYLDGVTDRMRIKHGDEIYDIISVVDPEAAHHELVCYCRLVQ